jgi:hypothetical protein
MAALRLYKLTGWFIAHRGVDRTSFPPWNGSIMLITIGAVSRLTLSKLK